MIVIIACMHGDELLGKEVIDLLKGRIDARFVIANPHAVERNVRFIESDLNRSFPGSADGTQEERIAHSLLKELEADLVIDIHSTTAVTKGFAIAVERSPQALLDAVPLDVVLMPASFASGRALIDHADGISLEFSRDADPAQVARVVIDTISNLAQGIRAEKALYVGKEIAETDGVLENFKPAPGSKLYAVLSGEKAYGGRCILCEKR
jgi:predicted deacylase